jgi:mono/diheme cytochrome c family protein
MARQPSYRPLEKSDFFDDGRASRPLVAGTVPWRGRARGDETILTYRKGSEYADMNAFATLLPSISGPGIADYVDICPIAIDKKALERGRDRFNIYCAVCHDALGTGNGKIIERGYLKPPNYHSDYSRGFERRGQKVLLREAPIGYIFEVVTRGFGAMPDYASQVPPDDRWKIVAYVRVLQRSQWMPLQDLPKSEQDRIRGELKPVEERP